MVTTIPPHVFKKKKILNPIEGGRRSDKDLVPTSPPTVWTISAFSFEIPNYF